jgi:nucleotide-binding universal stress UspA family protein
LPQKTESAQAVQEVVSLARGTGLKARGEYIGNILSVPGAIIEYANEWKIDLIVLGTRGLTGFRKMLLGSVSASVLEKARCSVLIVR